MITSRRHIMPRIFLEVPNLTADLHIYFRSLRLVAHSWSTKKVQIPTCNSRRCLCSPGGLVLLRAPRRHGAVFVSGGILFMAHKSHYSSA